MSKAVQRFREFFGAGEGKGSTKSAPTAKDKRTSKTPMSRVRRVPPRHPVEDPLKDRAQRYLTMLVARDVDGLVSSIVDDLDKEEILREVEALRRKHPRLSNARLSDLLIKDASNAMSVAAVASGLAWAVPGVGIATGSVATAAEMVAMIVYQSRLVVSVAAVYGHDIRSRERARDVLICVASSTAGTAVQMGVQAAVRAIAERIAAALARRTATAMVKSIPVAGTVAGLAGGAAGAVFNRLAVRAVGRYAVKFYGTRAGAKAKEPPRAPPVQAASARRSRKT
jgi:hypothetical protein